MVSEGFLAHTDKAPARRRGEPIERSFAHLYDTGGMRRVHLRGGNNIAKRALIRAAAFNLSFILLQNLGLGEARQAATCSQAGSMPMSASSSRGFVHGLLTLSFG